MTKGDVIMFTRHYYFTIILIVFVLICMCSRNNPITPKNEPTIPDEKPLKRSANSASMVEDFNDGIISNIWNITCTDKSKLYEANGVLNVEIGTGVTKDGYNQVAGLSSKDYILHGDFDVQIDFQLNNEYHSTPEANTKLMLVDRNGYGLEISVRTRCYISKEVFPGGSGIVQNTTFTDDLVGKLRIVRSEDFITNYFWKNGWQKHAQWTPTKVSGDLTIGFDTWNSTPYFLAITTKFDNIQISTTSGVTCVE